MVPGAVAHQVEDFLIVLGADFLELEPLPPHQQQSHDVSEINPAWIGLPFETLKAINQQVFVDVQPASLALGRNSANPKPEGPGRRSLPAFTAVVLANEFAVLFDKDGVDAFPEPQFAARGGTSSCIRL